MTLFFTGVFILSLILTGFLRHYALARNIIDIPNHRSSHSIPTPRGGGLAFVFSFIAVIPFLYYQGFLDAKLTTALLTSGLFVAVLGFVDDRKNISAKWRLAGHFAASAIALFYLGGMPAISILGWNLPQGIILNVFVAFYLVWLLNLYNFMDGIDGIAGVEAVSVCVGGALLYWLEGAANDAILPLVLAFAVAGFLYWNFPPARIFMGDAGSGFLGFSIGIISIKSANIQSQFFWSWLILLGVFIVDATMTLVRRALSGAKVFEAHRSHAYQYASRYFGKHLPVTLAVLMINFVWLLPLALLVSKDYIAGFPGMLLAYLPLLLLALKFQAGKPEENLTMAVGK
ncbi:MraY family glycosyltransferase [Legionella israelensis]|uniref:Alpha-N-acetylglucosaminyltransferase n=1 Tax=Legionella israelensis TaxID=454 RepID=A0A0W0WNT2_9GAMM|nr:glycosyltransferase family 4 protein [Legionella israelensis]KTD33971.1 alpha-N-acetylglucosaminyltransferase [Legionella israelensis]QBS10693.1 glycosyltransferase family 4 protein [Legionella israelensis]SCX83552.1 Fuc2NAc and GlcNAc transferase [Legionella israelensis DSM 19235]STX57649.1 alpha-N-acetylglucosaminyltransferase [Legionella israelensis]